MSREEARVDSKNAVSYELIRSSRRSLALEITPDCRVVVRAPLRTAQKQIDAFVAAHEEWLAVHMARQQARRAYSGTAGGLSAPRPGGASGPGGPLQRDDGTVPCGYHHHRGPDPLRKLQRKEQD